ncbi:probable serine/threonine-protein kinase PBL19 isoform X2 [Camellia sinensis]|uniref:probable serine/threonine-protein kinase PBL19 isoform X2 n=1 Tax=Camellia sinensis TaxID=4442 RepID=UPI00103561D9|nr:probable serine/threonine-protein kinase PBL19 isoform X2 [Camellia sinensis]
MKCCFFPFKAKSESQQEKSAPELKKQSSKSDNSAANKAIQSVGSVSSPRSIPELYKEKEHNLRVFSFSELRTATNDFNKLLKIGEGGFGNVYKGTIRPPNGEGDPIVVAIKKLNKHGLQGHKQWLAEVQFLGVVDHPNLVKLLGYCSVDGERGIQRLLVYEYMPNKSLEDHLFNRVPAILPWKTRLEIMLSAAQGLVYLHEELEVQVVGTYGYAAPEYVETGRLTIKSDIYNFGVVLYEILTGRRTLERNRPLAEQKLLEWVKQYPSDSKRFSMIIDPKLRNQYSFSAARKIAKLADSCLDKNPKDRPSMSQVVESLKEAIADSEEGNSSESSASNPVVTSRKHSHQMGVSDTTRKISHLPQPRDNSARV